MRQCFVVPTFVRLLYCNVERCPCGLRRVRPLVAEFATLEEHQNDEKGKNRLLKEGKEKATRRKAGTRM